MGPGLFQFRWALALVLREFTDCSLKAESGVLAWGSAAVEPGSGTLWKQVCDRSASVQRAGGSIKGDSLLGGGGAPL